MFGLGLLLGAASRAFAPRITSGGALGGLLNRSSGMGGMQQQGGQSPASSKDAPMENFAQEEAGQTKPQTQVAQPQQQPFKPVEVQSAAAEIATPAAQQKSAQANALSGLLDDAPAAPEPSKKPGEPVSGPQDVTNKTATMTPVAKPTSEILGQTPMLEPTEILPNRLMDAATNRQPFEYQDANPSRQPDLPNQSYTADQGYRYVGQTTVGGAMPSRRYRMGA